MHEVEYCTKRSPKLHQICILPQISSEARFIYLLIYVSIHPSIYLSIHLSIYLSICLSIKLFSHRLGQLYLRWPVAVCPSRRWPTSRRCYLSIYQSIYLSIHLSIYPSIYLSIRVKHVVKNLSIYLSFYPSIYLFIRLSILVLSL